MKRNALTTTALFSLFALSLAAGCGQETSLNDEIDQMTAEPATATSGAGVLTGSNCTRPGAYWKANNRYALLPANQIPWPLDEDMPACGQSIYYWVTQPVQKGNVWHELVRSVIGVMLNRAQGAYVPLEVRSAVDAAKPLLFACNIQPANYQQAWNLIPMLDAFTNGTVGPGPCP